MHIPGFFGTAYADGSGKGMRLVPLAPGRLPAVYSSTIHKLAAHWRSDASLGHVGLMTPSESAITTGNIAYAVNAYSQLGSKDFKGVFDRDSRRVLALAVR